MTWKVSSYKILFESSITDLKKGQSESHSVVSDSLRPHALYSPWNSPHQNTGVGSLSLLQRIFPIQGSNPGLLHCRRILYQLNHKGSPRILEWVAYPFSSGSSWPRNRTRVSCNAGGFFTNWAIREAKVKEKKKRREEGKPECFTRAGATVCCFWKVLTKYSWLVWTHRIQASLDWGRIPGPLATVLVS